MRLYRFIDTDKKIDATVVSGEGFTKGSSEYSVIAAANTGAERTGQAVVTANEGGKTATITLTQLGV